MSSEKMRFTPNVEDASREGSAEAWMDYQSNARTCNARLRNQVHAYPDQRVTTNFNPVPYRGGSQVVDHTQEFTAVEFCAGYAGIHLGLKRAIPNLRLVALSEIEAFPVANLVSKMEAGLLDPAPIWTDLKTFPGQAFRGKVGILVGGYPCQPFSAAGKRGGTEDPRHLWPYIRRQIQLMQPDLCFFENVDGHISLGLREVLADLRHLGYRVESDSGEPTWGVFAAAEVGAPHQRKRVFILAVRGDLLADGNYERLQGWNGAELPECGPERAAGAGCASLWPSRPGEPQYCWEPPRTCGGELAHGHKQHDDGGRDFGQGGWSESSDQGVGETFSALGLHTDGTLGDVDRTLTPNGHNGTVAAGGTTYAKLSGKTYAREVLRHLWREVEEEEIQQSAGGYVRLLAETVLLSGVQLDCFTQRICYLVWSVQEGHAAQGLGLRGMWGADPAWDSPQGQEPREQLKRELAYAMCQLSYEIALERGQAPLERERAVPDMWHRWEAEAWYVSEALPEMEEVWRSFFGMSFRQERIYPQAAHQGRNRVDELRLLGNGVVPATVEKAFRVLMARFCGLETEWSRQPPRKPSECCGGGSWATPTALNHDESYYQRSGDNVYPGLAKQVKDTN